MKADKVRELDSTELEAARSRGSQEQMFRLRFQMCMGQTEGLKKYRAMLQRTARAF